MSILVFSMIAFPLFLPEDKTGYCLLRSQQPGYLFYITNLQRNLTRRHKYPLVYSVHRDSYYSLRSAVDHEAEKFVDIFFLICNDLKFRDFSAGEDICKRYVLGKFGFEVQSVSFTCYQFYFAFTAIYYFKKFVNVFNI